MLPLNLVHTIYAALKSCHGGISPCRKDYCSSIELALWDILSTARDGGFHSIVSYRWLLFSPEYTFGIQTLGVPLTAEGSAVVVSKEQCTLFIYVCV